VIALRALDNLGEDEELAVGAGADFTKLFRAGNFIYWKIICPKTLAAWCRYICPV
jgi:hypothetical protein